MRPTKPGLYWHWEPEDSIPGVVSITVDSYGQLVVWWHGNEWEDLLDTVNGQFAGPLVPPERG